VIELPGLRPELQPWARRLLAQARQPYEVTSVRRSRRKQTKVYRRSLKDPEYEFPVAPPTCDCATHMDGWSWDMISTPAELRRLGMLWRSWGGIWGSDEDPIHFQGTPAMLSGMPQDERSTWGPMYIGRNDRSFIRRS